MNSSTFFDYTIHLFTFFYASHILSLPLSIIFTRINHQITAPEVRVIGPAGENFGVMPKGDALKLAMEKGLDLIEVSPRANPPVCRIMSFDKFRYEEEKKRKKQHAATKGQELKQIQISVREARHDLDLKLRRVNEFLSEGHPVIIALVLRGREKANRDFARQKLDDFLALITTPHLISMAPRWGMRGLNVQIIKK